MTRMVDLLIVHARQLVTCASGGTPKRGADLRDAGIIPDGALAIHGGVIVAVGTTADITAAYTSARVIDASGKAVCPGFVDCHTHAVFAGDRLDEFEARIAGKSYMEIMQAGGGIASTMRATRAASLDDLIETARVRLHTMMTLGTTTVEIKTGYGLDTESEVKMLRAIAALDGRTPQTVAPTFLGAHAVPPDQADMPAYADYVLEDMLPAIADAFSEMHFSAPLFVDVFCEQGVFDVDTSQKILLMAKERYGMLVKAHVDEFVNLGGVSMALALDAVSVDHLDVTPQEELVRLAASNTVGVLLPAVNFNLGSAHFGSARALVDVGGVLALSTDYNPGSAPTLSLPMVMAIACRYQKLLPSEALNACTINAAHALNLGGRVGSLEVGKQADVLILGAGDYRLLAYEFGAGAVEQVIIKGETVWMS